VTFPQIRKLSREIDNRIGQSSFQPLHGLPPARSHAPLQHAG
jgi:hypothetical protein